MHAMIRMVLVFTTSFVFLGCTALTGFDHATDSGKQKGTVALALIPLTAKSGELDKITEHIRKHIDKNDLSNERLKASCPTVIADDHELVGAAVPLIVAAAKVVFDLYMDAKIRNEEKLKKAAQATYSERVILENNDLEHYGCALITRGPKDKSGEFAALIKLQKVTEKAFVAKPVYIGAKTAVAITSKEGPKTEPGDKNPPPSINVSIAVSVKGIGKQHELPILAPVGEGSFSVATVKIGPSAERYTCSGSLCPTSDLIPYVGDVPSSLTISVNETGNIGHDFDQRSAELKALKEALGPALKDALTEALK